MISAPNEFTTFRKTKSRLAKHSLLFVAAITVAWGAAAQSSDCLSCGEVQEQLYEVVCDLPATTSSCELVALVDAAAQSLLAAVSICSGSGTNVACLIEVTANFRAVLQAGAPAVDCPNRIDSDTDGLLDAWEIDALGDLSQTAGDDSDGDGLTNGAEQAAGTDPLAADSDGDGIPDGLEVSSYLDPLNGADAAADTDGDGWSNWHEIMIFGTEHFDAGSGVNDNFIGIGTPPLGASTSFPGLAQTMQADGSSAHIPAYAEPASAALGALPVFLAPGHLTLTLGGGQTAVADRLYRVGFCFFTELRPGLDGTYEAFDALFKATGSTQLQDNLGAGAPPTGPGFAEADPKSALSWVKNHLSGGTVPTFSVASTLPVFGDLEVTSVIDATTGQALSIAGATLTSNIDSFPVVPTAPGVESLYIQVHPHLTDVDAEIRVSGGALLSGHGTAADPHDQRAAKAICAPPPGDTYELEVMVPTANNNRVANVKRIVVVSISNAGTVTFDGATTVESPPTTGWKSFYDSHVGATPVYVSQGSGIAAIVEFPTQAAAASGHTFTLKGGSGGGAAQISVAVNSITPKEVPGANPGDPPQVKAYTSIPLVTGASGSPDDFEVDVSADRSKFYHDFIPGHTYGPDELFVWATGTTERTSVAVSHAGLIVSTIAQNSNWPGPRPPGIEGRLGYPLGSNPTDDQILFDVILQVPGAIVSELNAIFGTVITPVAGQLTNATPADKGVPSLSVRAISGA